MEYIGVHDYMRLTNISSRETVYQLLKSGQICGAHKRGRRWRIPIDSSVPAIRTLFKPMIEEMPVSLVINGVTYFREPLILGEDATNSDNSSALEDYVAPDVQIPVQQDCEGRMVDPIEFAKMCGVSRMTIYRMLNDNQIPGATKLRGQWRIPVKASDTTTEVA